MTKQSTDAVGVILAAGKGSRMAQLPSQLPKCVLPVLGKPILYHQLELLAEVGIRQALIVVGHRGFEVVREIERLPNPGVAIDYVEQGETLGIAHSVGRLEPRLDRPFLLLLGDIYFQTPRLDELFRVQAESNCDAVLGAIREPDRDAIRRNFCIVANDTGQIRRVIEKPRFPATDLKGVGAYLFTPIVFDAIRRTPRTAMRDEYEITDSIQILIDDGHHVRAATCTDADINVTYPHDLLTVNLERLRERGLSSYYEPGSLIDPSAQVQRCVIGRNAQIGAGARLVDSLVFGDAIVPPRAELHRTIVTPQGNCAG